MSSAALTHGVLGRDESISTRQREPRCDPCLMARYFTADLHLGHRNIIDYSGRPFRDAEQMNGALVERWNTTVTPEDEVIVLGDDSGFRAVADASR